MLHASLLCPSILLFRACSVVSLYAFASLWLCIDAILWLGALLGSLWSTFAFAYVCMCGFLGCILGCGTDHKPVLCQRP